MELTRAVGDVLRRVRRRRGLTLYDIARRTGGTFKPSALGGYERGERSISLRRFCELADVYGVPPDHLLAEVMGELPRPGREEVLIDLKCLDLLAPTKRVAVEGFVRKIQIRREDYGSDVITLRSGDLEIIASLADTDPATMLKSLRPALRSVRAKDPATLRDWVPQTEPAGTKISSGRNTLREKSSHLA